MANLNILYNNALNNLKSKQFDIAIEQYKYILKIDNSFTQAWFDLSYIYLVQKKFKLGWKYYEHRLNMPTHPLQTNIYLDKKKLLKNEDISNKTILIFCEQGFGDTIQFIRFVDLFQKKYPNTKIILHIQKSLVKLIQYNYQHIKVVSELKNIKYDYCIPLLSLPYKLKCKYHLPIKSYLSPQIKNKIVFDKNKLNIGICWQGNKKNTRDKYRSINLNLLLSILSKKDIQLYSLQKDIKTSHPNIIDIINDFDDFNDSANLIYNLDLVITVDTSIAHLAGALGVKTYLLLPFLPDYRWGLEDTKSYWYYNTFLFRQEKEGNWTIPLIKLNNALSNNLTNDFLTNIQNALFYQKENSIELSNFYFKKGLKQNKKFAQGYIGHGNNLLKQKRYKLAKKQFLKAIQLDSLAYEAYYNIASIYVKKDKLTKAIKFYKKTLSINPNHLDGLKNLAELYKYKGKLSKSIFYYKKVLQIEPDNYINHMNLSIVLIMSKNFKQGWREYEYRWEIDSFKKLKSKFTGTMWNRENLNNKKLLIFTEQGFGDNIQFIRLTSKIKKLYPKATIIVQTHKTLMKLFNTISCIDKTIDFKTNYNNYDYMVPIMSLPYLLNLRYDNIPNKTPYLFPKKQKLLKNTNKLRVGIVWAGSNSKNNENRSVKLKHFKQILDQKGCIFYSLQVDKARKDLKKTNFNIIDLGKDFNTFYDTAKAILNLDLVITIDTSVAHLSGALNIPTWVILPARSGYLWMQNKKNSPWYPSITLYRQKKINKWGKLFKQIKKDLQGYKNGKKI